MAETYRKYRENRERSASRSMETRVNAIMDQTELLVSVCTRVQAFVDAYMGVVDSEIKRVAEIRNDPKASERSRSVADNMELDVQTLYATPNDPSARLLLDDLIVLLEQLPAGYKP
jgi:hypothetical protein